MSKKSKKKVFITGIKGFLGSSIAKALKKNRIGVDGTDLEECDLAGSYPKHLPEELLNRIESSDMVIHCAAIVGVDAHLNDTSAFMENYAIDANVVEACRLTQTPLIYLSSSEVFGESNNISVYSDFKISRCYRSNYALEKLMMERIIRAYVSDYVILRPFNVTGPTQDPSKGVIPKFFELARNNKDIEIYAEGGDPLKSPARSFLYIDDFCELIKRIVLNFEDFEHNSYNVGTMGSILIADLAREIIELTKSKSQIKFVEPRRGDNVIYKRELRDTGVWYIAGIEGYTKIEDILKKF